jgi:branched-chain amino acid transport system ATP-binding protein
MLLTVRDLVVHIGRVEVLHGINLEVSQGTIVALLGANGAGKSTTLRTISGLIRLAAGEIRYDGKPIQGKSPREIVSLGIVQVPEGRRVFPHMSVEENLKVGAYLRSDSKETVRQDMKRIFEHFPVLEVRRWQYAGSMSGGEQQMLAIGRGLMARPRVLLLDEPSLGLAPLVVDEIAKIIEEINRGGMTILLVEQNAEMALSVASYGFVLEIGRVALQGVTADLLANDTIRQTYLGGDGRLAL